MKKILLLSILLLFISCDSSNTRTVTEYEVPETITCTNCGGYGSVQTYYGIMQCPYCAGTGMINVNSASGPNVSFGSSTRRLVQTDAECDYGACQCSGYKGYKHDNGTYEGLCQHSDGYGHTCGHSPEKHGLRSW